MSPTLGEEVRRAVLPSGLQVYVCPKRTFRRRFAAYSVRYGSIDSVFAAPGETEPRRVPDGIAHFLEHVLFETPQGNVSDLFARHGASSNAVTSLDATTYLFSATDRFFECLSLLLDFVENPWFDPGKIEKEKGIIAEEIRMCRDDPGWVSYMSLLGSLFRNHPLKIDIAGTQESIAEIDAAALDRCYKTFYAPSNMILFLIGDLEIEEVFDFVLRRSRGAGPQPATGGIRRIYPEEPPETAARESRKTMEVAVPKLLLGFKEVGVPACGRSYLRRELLMEFALDFLFGRGSDGFQRLYEAQMVFDDFGASYQSSAGVGCAVVGGETPRPEDLREAILSEISRVRGSGIPAADFERQKRKFMGSFIRHFNSLEYIAGNYTYFRFHDADIFEAIDILEGIGREEVEVRIGDLDPARSAASVILPKS